MTKNEERIILAHGGGGELTRVLLEERIIPKITNELLDPLTDSAVFSVSPGSVCMTTDSFVVMPVEFPGGDIGRLAVCGTVNDLAVMGATPRVLSLALIIEEGFPFALLDRIVDSIAAAAEEASVVIGTGDTKVIESRSPEPSMMITTAGIGEMPADTRIGIKSVSPGDVIVVTGPIAQHGLAVMSAREGLSFETDLLSDVAPLAGLAAHICQSQVKLKFMRDPTRSGLAGVLVDLAEQTGSGVEIEQSAIPMTPVALHTAELLGLDPLTVANEGVLAVVVAADDSHKLIDICREHEYGKNAAIIGKITDSGPAQVELITSIGGRRLVQRPYGEELPRIC